MRETGTWEEGRRRQGRMQRSGEEADLRGDVQQAVNRMAGSGERSRLGEQIQGI